MPPEILSALMDFGALGLASGAIFWLYIRANNRQEEMIISFQAQLKEQVDECNKREAAVRDRYDAVVRKYDEERLEMLQTLGHKLDALERDMRDLEGFVKEGLSEMREHYAKISAVLRTPI
tara:strand:+ start:1420 stop:1782 length:363 start_codon:yes stop_codon:yes gene_type:complete